MSEGQDKCGRFSRLGKRLTGDLPAAGCKLAELAHVEVTPRTLYHLPRKWTSLKLEDSHQTNYQQAQCLSHHGSRS
jgi:hypothetical protein